MVFINFFPESRWKDVVDWCSVKEWWVYPISMLEREVACHQSSKFKNSVRYLTTSFWFSTVSMNWYVVSPKISFRMVVYWLYLHHSFWPNIVHALSRWRFLQFCGRFGKNTLPINSLVVFAVILQKFVGNVMHYVDSLMDSFPSPIFSSYFCETICRCIIL